MVADFNKNYDKLLVATNLLKEIEDDLKLYSEDALKEVTSEQQDILHIIENGTITEDEIKIELINHLQAIRNSRRNIKKLIEMKETINQSLTLFLTHIQHSKNHLTNLKNSFNTPIYRIRNQHIYDTYLQQKQQNNIVSVAHYLEDTALKDLKHHLPNPTDNHTTHQPEVTYVKNEEELAFQIKEKKQEQLSSEKEIVSNSKEKVKSEENFEYLLSQQNIIEVKNNLKKEDKELLAKKIKHNIKNKKKKSKALKKLKELKNKENKQTVLDLFKELEKQRQKK